MIPLVFALIASFQDCSLLVERIEASKNMKEAILALETTANVNRRELDYAVMILFKRMSGLREPYLETTFAEEEELLSYLRGMDSP